MGNTSWCCAAYSEAKVSYEIEEDLPIASTMLIMDPRRKFEKVFPFYRIHILHFFAKIKSIKKKKITLNDLEKIFTTPAWVG